MSEGLKLLTGIFGLLSNGATSLANGITAYQNRKRIKRSNEMNRGVTEYMASDLAAFLLPAGAPDNIIVSGGINSVRANAVAAVAAAAVSLGTPAVVLHEGNAALESALAQQLRGGRSLSLINGSGVRYEPFNGMPDPAIGSILLSAAPKDYGLNANANYYIDGMTEYLRAIGQKPTMRMFLSCPFYNIFAHVDNKHAQGVISDAQAQSVKTKLMAGQSEALKIERFIHDLGDQMEPLLPVAGTRGYIDGIFSAANRNGLIAIDIISNTNILLLEYIARQIEYLAGKGRNLLIVVDSIGLDGADRLAKLLKSSSVRLKKIVCAADFYSLAGANGGLFDAVLGHCKRTAILSHASGASAKKWAETIGYYDKIQTEQQRSKGYANRSMLDHFTGKNVNTSETFRETREYIIKPEAIMRMADDEAYVLNGETKEISHFNTI